MAGFVVQAKGRSGVIHTIERYEDRAPVAPTVITTRAAVALSNVRVAYCFCAVPAAQCGAAVQ